MPHLGSRVVHLYVFSMLRTGLGNRLRMENNTFLMGLSSHIQKSSNVKPPNQLKMSDLSLWLVIFCFFAISHCGIASIYLN